jgi:ribosomal protein L32
MRSGRHEPAREFKRHTLRFALPLNESFRGHTSLPGVRSYATQHSLRHQRLATVDTVVIRKQLQRQRLLMAHTVYQCPSCGEQSIGERRCSECGLFGRSVGLGGNCPDCDCVILLADLLEQDLAAPS